MPLSVFSRLFPKGGRISRAEAFQEALKSWILGVSIATPTIAILQGAIMLHDFRHNHRDAPFPEMPCSGIVIVKEEDQDEKAKQASSSSWFPAIPFIQQQKNPDPLRLLVVGDSLAAGVGATESATPALPEAIAKALSKSLGGRAVYYYCIGEPGLSSHEIARDLLAADSLWSNGKSAPGDDGKDIPDILHDLKDWWHERRFQHQEQRRKEEEAAANLKSVQRKGTRAWWGRTRTQLQEDWTELRQRFQAEDIKNALFRRRRTERLPILLDAVKLNRRDTTVPEIAADFDVAVVLTGFNDLKNIMFPPPSPTQPDDNPTTQKFETELKRLVHALRDKMKRGLPGRLDAPMAKETDRKQESNSATRDTENNNLYEPNQSRPKLSNSPPQSFPMVVFPALPSFMEQVAPLCFFAGPITRRLENKKRRLAESYPAPVLFLEGPSPNVVSDFENQRGRIWEAKSKEDVLLIMSSQAKQGREKVERLMKKYADKWAYDVLDEEPRYNYDEFGPDLEGPLLHLTYPSKARRGASLVSFDGVHPSDDGYELWGRHIAEAIIREWGEKDNK